MFGWPSSVWDPWVVASPSMGSLRLSLGKPKIEQASCSCALEYCSYPSLGSGGDCEMNDTFPLASSFHLLVLAEVIADCNWHWYILHTSTIWSSQLMGRFSWSFLCFHSHTRFVSFLLHGFVLVAWSCCPCMKFSPWFIATSLLSFEPTSLPFPYGCSSATWTHLQQAHTWASNRSLPRFRNSELSWLQLAMDALSNQYRCQSRGFRNTYRLQGQRADMFGSYASNQVGLQ